MNGNGGREAQRPGSAGARRKIMNKNESETSTRLEPTVGPGSKWATYYDEYNKWLDQREPVTLDDNGKKRKKMILDVVDEELHKAFINIMPEDRVLERVDPEAYMDAFTGKTSIYGWSGRTVDDLRVGTFVIDITEGCGVVLHKNEHKAITEYVIARIKCMYSR